MCGNLGDPIVAKDTLEVFRYFRQHNDKMWLGMNTNGGARDEQWWTELANIYGRNGAVIFSIDGLEDTNHIYRQGVVWSSVERSFSSFIKGGGRARWDYLIFSHNEHQVEAAREVSVKFGFEKFVSKKTGRFITTDSQPKDVHVAVERKTENTVTIEKPSEKYQNSALLSQRTILEKWGSMDNYYDNVEIKCKVKDVGNLFITAEGLALPCCWTAGRMYKWWHKDPKVEQIWSIIDSVGGKEKLNAKNGLQSVFNTGIFDEIEQSWSKPSCQDGKLKVCSMKCGTEFDPFTSQFK
jgi:hypothetical protein